jgi:hypothetical protein
MEMINYFICCSECFHKIAKKSPEAAKLWMHLCKNHTSQDTFMKWDNDNLQILEEMNFIVSTDCYTEISAYIEAEHVKIKVLGSVPTLSNTPFFCGKQHQ